MKKTLIAAGLILTVLSCSAEKQYEKSGKCIKCGKNANWNSIGFCSKHYVLKKEQTLRGVAKNGR